jgi:hypothetical protein
MEGELEFDKNYIIELQSLPKSIDQKNQNNFVVKTIKTPVDPRKCKMSNWKQWAKVTTKIYINLACILKFPIQNTLSILLKSHTIRRTIHYTCTIGKEKLMGEILCATCHIKGGDKCCTGEKGKIHICRTICWCCQTSAWAQLENSLYVIACCLFMCPS